ncbi:MAG: hypothetical protein AABY15_02140 [Nanoarchaeota archaeon]
MNVDLSKDDLKRLLQSTWPDMQFCSDQTKLGHMKFTGNQHNEKWAWEDSYLDSLSEQEIWNLYQTHK